MLILLGVSASFTSVLSPRIGLLVYACNKRFAPILAGHDLVLWVLRGVTPWYKQGNVSFSATCVLNKIGGYTSRCRRLPSRSLLQARQFLCSRNASQFSETNIPSLINPWRVILTVLRALWSKTVTGIVKRSLCKKSVIHDRRNGLTHYVFIRKLSDSVQFKITDCGRTWIRMCFSTVTANTADSSYGKGIYLYLILRLDAPSGHPFRMGVTIQRREMK